MLVSLARDTTAVFTGIFTARYLVHAGPSSTPTTSRVVRSLATPASRESTVGRSWSNRDGTIAFERYVPSRRDLNARKEGGKEEKKRREETVPSAYSLVVPVIVTLAVGLSIGRSISALPMRPRSCVRARVQRACLRA